MSLTPLQTSVFLGWPKRVSHYQNLSDALITPVSLLQTQQVMTSQIRSHIEYLIDLSYFCAHFVVETDEKSSLNGGF